MPTTTPAAHGLHSTGKVTTRASVKEARSDSATPRPQQFWLEAVAVRLSHSLGSLQAAVSLLVLFVMVLIAGTMIDSWYSNRIAQDVIYRAWWFKLLLFLLGVNIFFAAAKKWPWKRQQTGFLITHLGLLLLVTGGEVTSFSGIDGQMPLIDTAQRDMQRENGMQQTSNQVLLPDDTSIRVNRLASDGRSSEVRTFSFDPGPLAWHTGGRAAGASRAFLGCLAWLEHPLPSEWSVNLQDGARLQVLDYYPHARREAYSAAPAGNDGRAALKVVLKSPYFGRVSESWLALDLRNQVQTVGPAGLIELLGRCPGPLAEEFLTPPPAGELGQRGVLAVVVGGGKTVRVRVDDALQRERRVGSAQIRVTRYWPNYRQADDPTPSFPAVEFDLTEAGIRKSYLAVARFAGVAVSMKDGQPADGDQNRLSVWYHPPDYRYGKGAKGVLQFGLGDDGVLYYRSFNSRNALGFALESSGRAEPGTANYPIWQGMNWEFQVSEFLPHAIAKVRYVPEDARPGLETPSLMPVVRCQMVRGASADAEFWLARDASPESITLESETYEVSYHRRSRPLDFDIRLLRAEQTVAPGTQLAATYSSYVQLSDVGEFRPAWLPRPFRPLTNWLGLSSGGQAVEHEDRVITMNQPLEHRGYKVYQSNYQALGWDDNLRPVSYSNFTVARDPGLPLKYLGSTFLALGIGCMFYMKAYFFKPRGRRITDSLPASN